jgi:CPA1 family monovalent cation:H+ antiporter
MFSDPTMNRSSGITRSLKGFITLFVLATIVFSTSACASRQTITMVKPKPATVSPTVISQPMSEPVPTDVSATVTNPDDENVIIIEEIVIALLFLATIVGIVARRLRVPYTVGLVLMGLVLSLMPQVNVHIPKNIILGLLVPPLVFEAAFHINLNELRRDLLPILAWAVPGVVLTMVLVGWIVSKGINIPLPYGLIFGAMIAATDPVAVIALFHTIGAPRRLQLLLEGESLLNDGTAIVLFGMVTEIVLTGSFSPTSAFFDFIRIAGGGLVIGLILGGLISQMISRIDDYLIETTLTSVLAFGSYLVAQEAFHVSGVLAVVAAGLINGNIGPRGMSPTTRIVVFNFWEYAGFLANSFAFLLIGLQIDLTKLMTYWQPILIAIAGVLLARALAIYGFAWIWRNISLAWQHTLFWGGLRGAISLALALGLPLALEGREQLQVMVFGVVVFTLLVQGSTMGRLVRRLRLMEKSPTRAEYERRHARAVAVSASYSHLERLKNTGLISEHTWQVLSPILEEYSQTLVNAVKQVILSDPNLESDELEYARREALRAQRSALGLLLRDGVISDETYSQLVAEIDAALIEHTGGWSEMLRKMGDLQPSINRLMTAIIQEQDVENAMSALTKLGLSVTQLSSVGGFLGRRNVTLLIGFSAGQEEAIVNALNQSCRRRVEYVAAPIEGAGMTFSPPIPIQIGGATVFVFEVEKYVEY